MKLPRAATYLLVASYAISAIVDVNAFLVPGHAPSSSSSHRAPRHATTTGGISHRLPSPLSMSAAVDATELKEEKRGETFE
jgi:hypothetical protein